MAFLPDATGKSGGWTSLGGSIEGRPSCLRLKSGEAACVAKGRSGRLHMWRGMPLYAENAGITSSSDDITTEEPACALDGGDLVCFTGNAQRQLVRRSLGTGVDTSHDGILESPQVSAVTCLSFAPEQIGCVLTDGDRKLQFAAGQKLEAGTAEDPSTAADEEAQGAWYLSNLQTGGACRVELAPELAFGAKRLRVGPACRRVGLPARPAQWDQDESELLFLAANGQVLVRFHSTRAGRWISPRRDAALLLTREPPEVTGEASTLPDTAVNDVAVNDVADRAEMMGPWRVFADHAGFVCTIKLTGTPLSGGYRAQWDPACGARFANAKYWNESGPAIVFVGAGENIVARFEPAGPGKWRAQNYGGITLMR